ncbi:MarR family winged helix-turn-helix transcriptional regulator [Candidatus Nitrotoga fabula]|uniref:Transcriptional regulator, MarR family n=1 Tax=Candidatus Nitrotoga fabula TaxID=2182327 RepID=A0A916BDD8_9PROT|nr:MarR family transcriptional regulator [Candidatus Nitrotoga fabula]CAE6731673.1 Transcriptional regulator, MarR family [Candidatus Nitrotoga fabula]
MRFLPVLRKLAQAYQSFEHYSASHLKSIGLTMTQFDIIATLGNQPPMTCKELGEKTLVTKGTLTGVLERLEGKGIIRRETNREDARSQMVSLTQDGQQLFEKVFPEHVTYLGRAFCKLTAREVEELSGSLEKLRSIF